MLRRLLNTSSRIGLISAWRRNSNSAMQNAYIRYPVGAPMFQFFVTYNNEALGVNRDFNLNRNSSESVNIFLQRLQQNIQKHVIRSFNKKKRKTKSDDSENDSSNCSTVPLITVELLQDGKIVPPEEMCSEVLKRNQMLTLSVTGKTYNVVLNSPWIHSIQLPAVILAGFLLYPSKFEGEFLEKSDCQFVWQKSASPDKIETWTNVGTGFTYVPTAEDVGCTMKFQCEPRRGHFKGPLFEVVSKSVVEAGPGSCPFEMRHAFTKERAEGNKFRIVSYNVLAGLYSDTEAAKTSLFSHCPLYALNIEYRKPLFMKEILGYNADIICLQEVDINVFENDLTNVFGNENYEGVYDTKGHSSREGLACFFNTHRFRLIEKCVSILSTDLVEQPYCRDIFDTIKDNCALMERVKDKTTATQAILLQSIDDINNYIVVGNTHLYFHPDADHVRLLQAGVSVRFLENTVQRIKEKYANANVSLVFCGDFNSTPECGIYRLMTAGSVSDDVIDWRSNESEAISGLSLSQSFSLDSACGTPTFTNYTLGFQACIDYIFYQNDNLAVDQIIPLFEEEDLKKYGALPNVVFPSDHIALVADLIWK